MTRQPPAARLRAMAPPMMPRPTTPTMPLIVIPFSTAKPSAASWRAILTPEDELAIGPFEQEEPGRADRTQDHDHRKGAVDAKLEIVQVEQVAEPFLRADELADDGADDREGEGRLHPGKDDRERVQEGDLVEDLQRRRFHGAH